MPPGCCERWRGRPAISRASASSARKRRSPARSRDARRAAAAPRPRRRRSSRRTRVARRSRSARRQAEDLAELADRAARPVGREDAAISGAALVAEALVHRQDQPLADVAREVEVDVGDGRQLAVQEAPEREAGIDRIDVREPGQVADDRADRRAAAAAGRQRHARRVRAAHLRARPRAPSPGSRGAAGRSPRGGGGGSARAPPSAALAPRARCGPGPGSAQRARRCTALRSSRSAPSSSADG